MLIGVICHRPHLNVVTSLGGEFGRRIVKTAYFGSGDERSSNDWHEKCDLIVIVGTPRIPPAEIASYLVQVGEVEAVCNQAEWGALAWQGRTESNEFVKVDGYGYRDEVWQRAHRDLVRGSLVQAIGRGRGILDTGCEVVVLSNEECGLAVSDAATRRLSSSTIRVLEALAELTIQNPNNPIIGKRIVSTGEIAAKVGLSPIQTRKILRELDKQGYVRKMGDRSGWTSVNSGD